MKPCEICRQAVVYGYADTFEELPADDVVEMYAREICAAVHG
jgi:hypothetical protein